MNLFFKKFTKKSTDCLITSIKYLIVTPRLVFEWIPDGYSLAKLIHKTDHHSYCGRSCFRYEKVKMLVSQSCLTLCDPTDCSPPDSSVHGILQARILEMLPCPSPVDLPDPGIEPRSPALQADSLLFEPQGKSLIIKFIPKK